MKWIKKLVAKWAHQGRNFIDEDSIGSVNKTSRLVAASDCESVGDEPILNFKVFSAVGGKVVEFRRYDRQRDRSDITTYIITNDQDFGERISKIATMEKLKL